MRVALLIEKFSPAGGAERQCALLARGLLARGHEVHIVARRIEALPGVIPHVTGPDGIFRNQDFANRCRFVVERENFDIVHSFTRTDRQDILRLGGGTHREYQIQTDRAYTLFGRFWRRLRPKERYEIELERESFRPQASLRIVAVSQRVKDEVMRHYGVPAEKILVFHNGVDANEFKPNPEARRLIRNQIGAGEKDFLLLFVGTGFRRKGLEYAISAIEKVPSAKLVVVGEGQATPHPRVAMLGRRADVAHLYAAADAFIFPTLYDPFPNVCLEAMASGLPIIVSRVAGVSEIIDGDSIVVDEPWNVDQLVSAIRRLEDPAVRVPMGEAARRKAQAHPIDAVIARNIALYDEVATLKRLGARNP